MLEFVTCHNIYNMFYTCYKKPFKLFITYIEYNMFYFNVYTCMHEYMLNKTCFNTKNTNIMRRHIHSDSYMSVAGQQGGHRLAQHPG